jgi:hypothetical protein
MANSRWPVTADTSRKFLLALLISAMPVAGFAQSRAPALPPAPIVIRDLNELPQQVRRMRLLIIEALRTGDVRALRTPIETNELPPSFENTPIGPGARPNAASAPPRRSGPAMADELLRIFSRRSGDGEGRETMGQLMNVFAVGPARVGTGTAQETFLWPYVAALDPRILTPEQRVDAYRVLGHAQFQEWQEKGRYPGWRLSIGPDGTWHYLHGAQ